MLKLLAANHNWMLTELEVYKDLFEEVYTDQLLGYTVKGVAMSINYNLVCKLHKSIYRLKQAS